MARARGAHAGAVVIAMALAVFAPPPTLAEVVITHQGVDCVVTGKFPVIRVRLEPPGEVARARVYFQARGTPHWYYVDMKSGADVEFAGILPRPLGSLDAFNYYIEALGPGFALSRSQEFSARVIAESESCPAGMTTATATGSVSSALVVGAPQGAPALPVGFSDLGLASSAGASAAGAGAAGAGGGISTGLVVGLGVAAGAGIAVAVAAGGGGGGEETTRATSPGGTGSVGTPAPQPTPTPTPAPDVTGRWAGQFVENPSTALCSVSSDLSLILQQSGGAVSGTFQLLIRTATPAAGSPCPVAPGEVYGGPLSGVVNDAAISLQLQITGGPSFFLGGTISGNRMGGTSPADSDGPGGNWDVTRQ